MDRQSNEPQQHSYPYPYGQPAYPPPYHPAPYGYPPAPVVRGRKHTAWRTAAVAGLVVAACAGGYAVGTTQGGTTQASASGGSAGNGSAASGAAQNPFAGIPGFSVGGGSSTGGGSTGGTSTGGASTGGTSTGGTAAGNGTGLPTATSAEDRGIVDVDSTLGYQDERGAGTGMVLDPSAGTVLTNNHVVDGATAISVTVTSTGRTYRADVVGTDPTQDVAVIKLVDASGLQQAAFASSGSVSTGTAVVGVGNAEGAGGAPTAASGAVTALNQAITATDDGGGNAEHLRGLIESSAPIEPGDSGGPLYAGGRIVGMDTAANATQDAARSGGRSGASEAYSIPIATALTVAHEITAGDSSSTVHLGLPGFLGISVARAADPSATGGAVIAAVLPNGAAANAGLAAGDVITAVNGTKVASPTALHDDLSGDRPGQSVSITYGSPSGGTQTSTVVLGTGPAD